MHFFNFKVHIHVIILKFEIPYFSVTFHSGPHANQFCTHTIGYIRCVPCTLPIVKLV